MTRAERRLLRNAERLQRACENETLVSFTHRGKARIVIPRRYWLNGVKAHFNAVQMGGESATGLREDVEWRTFCLNDIEDDIQEVRL